MSSKKGPKKAKNVKSVELEADVEVDEKAAEAGKSGGEKAPAPEKVKAISKNPESVYNPIADKCEGCKVKFKAMHCRSCVNYIKFYVPIRDEFEAKQRKKAKEIKHAKSIKAEENRLKQILSKD